MNFRAWNYIMRFLYATHKYMLKQEGNYLAVHVAGLAGAYSVNLKECNLERGRRGQDAPCTVNKIYLMKDGHTHASFLMRCRTHWKWLVFKDKKAFLLFPWCKVLRLALELFYCDSWAALCSRLILYHRWHVLPSSSLASDQQINLGDSTAFVPSSFFEHVPCCDPL